MFVGVDDCLLLGTLYFECDDLGFAKEYLGCKKEMDNGSGVVKFRQPVLIKRLDF
jgi:hypothetical protein